VKRFPGDLLGIGSLQRADVERLLARAADHKKALAEGRRSTTLAGAVVGTLFFEDSTRTRSSFDFAARALGADVFSWSASGSSLSKGESLLDTARNIDALGVRAMVIRHSSTGAPHLVARHVRAAVVNAGDGTNEHPSQALLDAFTLVQRLGDLSGKRIVIAGDIVHSRVARSNARCLSLLGAQVVFCGPPTLLPPGMAALGCQVSYDFDQALEGADAVMMLRVQLERMNQAMFPSAREYARLFGLNPARAARLAPQVPVLHPGPMNRGVEITSEVADGPRSAILQQVENGVPMRMAILEACAA